MSSSRLFDRPEPSSPGIGAAILERLQQPSALVPLILLLLTVIYQWLHSDGGYSTRRHPGQLLWDLSVQIIPGWMLYAIDSWQRPSLVPLPESMRPAIPRTYATKSEALRRVLGMDNPAGLVNSVASVGIKSLSALSSTMAQDKRGVPDPAGLQNIDNSCFQNSVLQGLSSLRRLPNYLAEAAAEDESADDGADGNAAPLQSASTLRQLIMQLKDTENNGKTFRTPAKLISLNTTEQQDAQEYLSTLLEAVEKDAAKAVKARVRVTGWESVGLLDDTASSLHSEDSGYQSGPLLTKTGSEAKPLRNPLEGLSAQRVACVHCKYFSGLSMTPFNWLTLNVRRSAGQQSFYQRPDQQDIYQLLDDMVQVEALDGVECTKCTLLKVQRLLRTTISQQRELGRPEDSLQGLLTRLATVEEALENDDFDETTMRQKCNIPPKQRVSVTKMKQMAIAKLPQSLVIHMNRSSMNAQTFSIEKISGAVRFPTMLDLGPWCLGSADNLKGAPPPDDQSMAEGAQSDVEQWVLQPEESMVSGNVYPSKITGPLYELRAVIIHKGYHENGHYICFRKHPRPRAKLEEKDFITDVEHSHYREVAGSRGHPSPEGEDAEADANGQWWRLSDELVRPVSEEHVLSQGDATRKEGDVFMLFYDCVDSNSTLAPRSQGVTESEMEAERSGEEDALFDDCIAPEEDSVPAQRTSQSGVLDAVDAEDAERWVRPQFLPNA